MNITDRKILLGFHPRITEYTVEQFLQLKKVRVGWTDLLLEMFEKLFEMGWDGRVSDCKEKFGTLRFHLDAEHSQHIDQILWDIVSEYEERSATVCEFCGHFPASVSMNRRWIKTMCEQCYTEDLAAHPTDYKS